MVIKIMTFCINALRSISAILGGRSGFSRKRRADSKSCSPFSFAPVWQCRAKELFGKTTRKEIKTKKKAAKSLAGLLAAVSHMFSQQKQVHAYPKQML